MASKTKIEWVKNDDGTQGQTWNFLRGCSRVSEGCGSSRGGGCYAEGIAARFSGLGQPYEGLARFVGHKPRWTGEVSFHEYILLAPLKRKKPTTYFVNSMSDLFHEKVKDEWLDKAFAVMALTPHHTYQILTKRPERMLKYCLSLQRIRVPFYRAIEDLVPLGKEWIADEAKIRFEKNGDALPNVHLGVSVEDQKTADERIPLLLNTPAAVRWISAEPLLGLVELARRINVMGGYLTNYLSGYHVDRGNTDDDGRAMFDGHEWTEGKLDWVVVGGESGPPARPMSPVWVRNIRDQCIAAEVPFFFKQWGEYVSVSEVAGPGEHYYFDDGATVRRVGKKAAGRTLDGRTWDEFPEAKTT